MKIHLLVFAVLIPVKNLRGPFHPMGLLFWQQENQGRSWELWQWLEDMWGTLKETKLPGTALEDGIKRQDSNIV